VIATGETHTVEEFCALAFEAAGLDHREFVEVSDQHKRPAEVDLLSGDASKARAVLHWEPSIAFPELVRRMVEADLALARQSV